MGSVLVDLREAVLEDRETHINANAVMGDVKILVPAHVHVVVDGPDGVGAGPAAPRAGHPEEVPRD